MADQKVGGCCITNDDHRVVFNMHHAKKISEGKERICYTHCHDPAKCIKVKKSAHGRQHLREFQYYRRLVRQNISMLHLPDFHGTVDTNMGMGLVFSLVQNYDGTIAKNLKIHIATYGTGGIAEAMRRLQSAFMEAKIITCDVSLDNFLVRHLTPETFELVLIDGVGNREFIPVSSHFACLARIKMRRRWNRLNRKLFRLYGIMVNGNVSRSWFGGVRSTSVFVIMPGFIQVF